MYLSPRLSLQNVLSNAQLHLSETHYLHSSPTATLTTFKSRGRKTYLFRLAFDCNTNMWPHPTSSSASDLMAVYKSVYHYYYYYYYSYWQLTWNGVPSVSETSSSCHVSSTTGSQFLVQTDRSDRSTERMLTTREHPAPAKWYISRRQWPWRRWDKVMGRRLLTSRARRWSLPLLTDEDRLASM